MNRDFSRSTFKILELGLEILAMGRAAISTWLVVSYITGGNQLYTVFTIGVVEGALLLSLVMLKRSPVAPITAIIAIAFSAVLQYMELRVLDGTITASEREMMRYAVAFSPIVLLTLAYIRRLFEDVDIAELAPQLAGRWTNDMRAQHLGSREAPTAELPAAPHKQSIPERIKSAVNGERPNSSG